jgi:hypothetical protein
MIVLCPVFTFLDRNYTPEYTKANNTCAKGASVSTHLAKLFRPGHLVAGRHQRAVKVTVRVLSDCILTESGGVLLVGWRWRITESSFIE